MEIKEIKLGYLPREGRGRANMRHFAETHDFRFPYLHDEDPSVARAYGAMCTPDFFGYDAEQKLRYRGRLDEGRTTPPPANARRELVEAMRAVVQGKAIGFAEPRPAPFELCAGGRCCMSG